MRFCDDAAAEIGRLENELRARDDEIKDLRCLIVQLASAVVDGGVPPDMISQMDHLRRIAAMGASGAFVRAGIGRMLGGRPEGDDDFRLEASNGAIEGVLLRWLAVQDGGEDSSLVRDTEALLDGALPANASQAYVSSQGVVRVPDYIRAALGLQEGGGVVFLEKEHEVHLISDAQFLQRLGAIDGE